MAWWPVWVVENFLCSYPVKAPSNKFLFFGGSTNLGNCEVWIHEKWGTSVLPIDRKMQRELENLSLPQDIVYLVSNAMTCNQAPTGCNISQHFIFGGKFI